MDSKVNHNPGLGEIRKNSCYTLREFQRRLGIGPAALRKMKAAGLPLRKIGKSKHILGDDWFEFVDKHTDDNWKFEDN